MGRQDDKQSSESDIPHDALPSRVDTLKGSTDEDTLLNESWVGFDDWNDSSEKTPERGVDEPQESALERLAKLRNGEYLYNGQESELEKVRKRRTPQTPVPVLNGDEIEETQEEVEAHAPLAVSDTLEEITAYDEDEAIEESKRIAQEIKAKIDRGDKTPTEITDISKQNHVIRTLKKDNIKINVSFQCDFNDIVDHINSSGLDGAQNKVILKELIKDLQVANEISFASIESAKQFINAAKNNGVTIDLDKIRINGSTLNEEQKGDLKALQQSQPGSGEDDEQSQGSNQSQNLDDDEQSQNSNQSQNSENDDPSQGSDDEEELGGSLNQNPEDDEQSQGSKDINRLAGNPINSAKDTRGTTRRNEGKEPTSKKEKTPSTRLSSGSR